MILIQGANNAHAMLLMYKAVASAPELTINSQKCRDAGDLCIVLDARQAPLTSFESRGLNLDYCKREWLWYLGADPKDDSIEQWAKLWAKIKQPDGSFFSNYGQYIFGKKPAAKGKEPGKSQFSRVISTLKQDPHSRQACIVFLNSDHFYEGNPDVVCTYSVNFRIRDGRLDMKVNMRSNDVIYGFTNDAFCFWSLYQMVLVILQRTMPELKAGFYMHHVDSMHVYERHYEMIQKIINADGRDYSHIQVPAITAEEAVALVNSQGKEGAGEYVDWLKAVA